MADSRLYENFPDDVQIVRWPHSHRLPEAEIVAYFSAHDQNCHRWEKEPRSEYSAHDHSYHKILFCIEGSISFKIEKTGTEITLLPGDRLILPKGIRHSAVVGPDGVSCIQGGEA